MKRGSGVGIPIGAVTGSARPRSCFTEASSSHKQRDNLALNSSDLATLRGVAGSGTTSAAAPFSQPCLPVKDTGPSRILAHLFLGSYQDSLNEQELFKLGINYVLNVSRGTVRPPFIPEERFMRIPVDDNYDAVLTPYFTEAFNFIDKAKTDNGCVLVHCMAGISRSATVAIGYFMKEHNCTHEEAMRFVKDRRPSIAPNFNFLGQLLELEKSIKSERMLKYHHSFGPFRTSSESHIGLTSSPMVDPSIEQLVTGSSRSLSVAMDEPKAPKRSRTDNVSSSSKTRPTGLNLAPTLSVSKDVTAKDFDIEAMVQSSLHVKTPEFQKDNPLVTATAATAAAGVNLTTDFALHSPICDSESQPTTPGSSNKSTFQMGSPMDDDSVFKVPLLPSPQSDLEVPCVVSSNPRLQQAPSLSPQPSQRAQKLTAITRKPTPPKSWKIHPGSMEINLDRRTLFASESKLFQAYCPKPLSPVEDCSPENTAAASALGNVLGISTVDCESREKTTDECSPPVSSDSSSTTTSSSSQQQHQTQQRLSYALSSAGRTMTISRHSHSFSKTRLMLSERLKLMIKRQHHKTGGISPFVSMSEGCIARNDEKTRAYEVTPVPPRPAPRARPSSFCIPAEYLDHWEELLAAARLSSRSMSCNMLEVRSRPFGGNDFGTSSSTSYDSLSRPSSLEAVEVGS